MILKLFAFPDDPLNSRARREHEAQAHSNAYANANAASRVRALKWLIAASGDDGAARDAASQNQDTSPAIVFIDGPSGFVFVYTAEGWKFVRGMNPEKL